MLENIPAELKALRQWVCHDKDKVPYQVNGELADVTNSDTWNSFDVVRHGINIKPNFTGIGFVFDVSDLYTFIDLDDTGGDQRLLQQQLEIFNQFDSYSEISPSGKGLHIIVKGKVPAGRRRSFVEIYSSHRYATMTGNIYPAGNPKPIADRQDLLTKLWESLGKDTTATTYKGDENEKYTDQEIIEQCRKAANGEKFNRLYQGKYGPAHEPGFSGDHTQSAADFALIDIISFYTQNRNQITRIFHSSELGKRQKAKRKDYLTWMINKSFDRILPPIDLDGFKNALELKLEKQNGISILDINGNNSNNSNQNADVAQRIEQRNSNPEVIGSSPIVSTTPIPGLIGEIATFIYQAAPRPVPEIALAAAIGLMAGICGRAYNVSGTGLNQYILLLAPTGIGKEAMSSGIDKLMAEILKSVPTANEFIGPSEIASGQALVRYLNDSSKCFISILDEFAIRLEVMSNPTANHTDKALKRMLLELYSKSGKSQMYRPAIFADKDKNTKTSACPSFSLLGYSTPEKFYAALNEDMIAEGLLPRFSLVEYRGLRPPLNKTHSSMYPSQELTTKLSDLAAYCMTIMHSNPQRWIDVQFSQEAQELADGFDIYCDQQINSTNKEVFRQLWNRAHLKSLKLAALIAIGCNPMVPTIQADYISIAIEMVCKDVRALSAKFEAGEVGRNTDEIKQRHEMEKCIREYATLPWDKIKAYCDQGSYKFYVEHLMTIEYLNRRISKLSAFKNDKKGATFAIDRAIKMMLDAGKLIDYNKHPNYRKLNTTKRLYFVTADALD